MAARPPAAGAGAAGLAALLGAPAGPAASTSFCTMRPPGPEPESAARSIPFSAATFFARGEALIRPPGSPEDLAEAAAGAAGFAVSPFCAGAGAGAASALSAAGAAAAGGGAAARGRFFTGRKQQGDLLADRHFLALSHIGLGQNAIVERLHFHGRLVRLDLGQDVAGHDFVARLLAPFDEGPLGHGVAQLGHFNVGGHGKKRSRKESAAELTNATARDQQICSTFAMTACASGNCFFSMAGL